MHKCLYLLCPTDYLESTINNTFRFENYFYTSLGNSFIYDDETLMYLKQLVKKQHIKEIYFVLSNDNKIILDALGNKDFSNIRALNSFYNEIRWQRQRSKISFQVDYRQLSVLSYYLNKKIKELELQLIDILNQSIKIKGKIYNRDLGVFINIYPDLVCLEQYHLN